MMQTIADAHRNYGLGLVTAQVGRELALLYGTSTDAHDAAIADCQTHIDELTAIEAPPADLQDHIDQAMQSGRDVAQNASDAWGAVDAGDPQAKYLYPKEWARAQIAPGLAASNRQQAEFYLSAIDAVWTPGGGN